MGNPLESIITDEATGKPLGIKAAASVTKTVPLRTATGTFVEGKRFFSIPVAVAFAAAKALGRADLSICGRAEARAFGRFETI